MTGKYCLNPYSNGLPTEPVIVISFCEHPTNERLEGELITLLQVSRQELPFREPRDGLAPKNPRQVRRCKSVMVHGEALALGVFSI